MLVIDALRGVNHIVSVGSVDGVCTSAALLRIIGAGKDVGLEFCQAFTVDRINPGAWLPGRQVALVDLAVNNREPAMTAGFITRLREAGHTLVAVIDEHSREDWLSVLGSFEGLVVEPQSQSLNRGDRTPKSSGEVLRRAWLEAGESFNDLPEARELLETADAGDRMDFTTHFGGIVNQAVKSAIADDSRRVHLARHFAEHREADPKIQGWVAEYETILANHDKIVAGRVDLGDGIVRVVATGLAVDMTTLMGRLYREGARVVVLEGEQYNKAKGEKMPMVSFGSGEKSLDLLAAVKAAGVASASGFANKVNVEPSDEQVALAAIRETFKA